MCETKDQLVSYSKIIGFIAQILLTLVLVIIPLYYIIFLHLPEECIHSRLLPRSDRKCEDIYTPLFKGSLTLFSKLYLMKNSSCPLGTKYLSFVEYTLKQVCDCEGIRGYNLNFDQEYEGTCVPQDTIGTCENRLKEGVRSNKIGIQNLLFCAKENYYGTAEEIASNSIMEGQSCPRGKKKCKISTFLDYTCVDEKLDCPTFSWFEINQTKSVSNLESFYYGSGYYVHLLPESIEKDTPDLQYYKLDFSKPGYQVKFYLIPKNIYNPENYDRFIYNPKSLNISYNFHAAGECVDFTKRFFNGFKGERFNLETLASHINHLGIFLAVLFFFFFALLVKAMGKCFDDILGAYTKCFCYYFIGCTLIGFLTIIYLRLIIKSYGGDIDMYNLCWDFSLYQEEYFIRVKYFCKLSSILLGINFGIFLIMIIYFREEVKLYSLLPCLNCDEGTNQTAETLMSDGKEKKAKVYKCCCCVCLCGKSSTTIDENSKLTPDISLTSI